MTTPVDALREAVHAAQVGKALGEYRRSRKSFTRDRVTSSRAGTRMPSSNVLREFDEPPESTGHNLITLSGLTVRNSAQLDRRPTLGIVYYGNEDLPHYYYSWYLREPDLRLHGSTTSWPESRTMGLTTERGILQKVRRRIRLWANVHFDYPEIVEENSGVPQVTHRGLVAVEWLRTFLGVSREQVLQIAGIPAATFYFWQSNPNSTVRPKSVARLLRVVASIKILIETHGEDRADAILKSGSPTLLDQLAGDVDSFETALQQLSSLATPKLRSPARSLTTADSILAELEELENEVGPVDQDPLSPAEAVFDLPSDTPAPDASDES